MHIKIKSYFDYIIGNVAQNKLNRLDTILKYNYLLEATFDIIFKKIWSGIESSTELSGQKL